jgi:hypothetical protein
MAYIEILTQQPGILKDDTPNTGRPHGGALERLLATHAKSAICVWVMGMTAEVADTPCKRRRSGFDSRHLHRDVV